MNERQKRVWLPAAFLAGSFLFMTLVVLLTSPFQNILYAILFFLALLVFLVSLGHLLVYIRYRRLSHRSRYRIFILSFFTLVLGMFSSAQSLSWLDILVVCLITTGLFFYVGRRTTIS
jgi:hypothetical protein